MSFIPCQRQTPYCVALAERVGQWFAQPSGAFTMKELAKFAGLPPTHNMRKRLRTWVDEGHLTQFTGLDEHGRMQIYYSLPYQEIKQEEIPF